MCRLGRLQGFGDDSGYGFRCHNLAVRKSPISAATCRQGIGYSLARTHINSCDFSSDTYSYLPDNDSLLNSFSVAHDEKFRIPFIKKAIEAAGGKLPIGARRGQGGVEAGL